MVSEDLVHGCMALWTEAELGSGREADLHFLVDWKQRKEKYRKRPR
jgi:hypothetical protein